MSNIVKIENMKTLIIEPKVFGDDRRFIFESFNRPRFAELTGRDVDVVRKNHSHFAPNMLRGLHYQIQHPQGKIFGAAELFA